MTAEGEFVLMPVNRYPRPLLRRARWQSLNGPWLFLFDDELRYRAPGDIDEWPLTIQVPFAPEARLSGIGDTGFHRCCWYQRDFDLDRAGDGGGRVILHFGAVDYRARAWVNAVPVVEHEGGHTPFSADITHALQP